MKANKKHEKKKIKIIIKPESPGRKPQWEPYCNNTLFTNFLRYMYRMKSSVSLGSALLVIIYFATGTCVILFLNPTIRTPGDAKAEN